MLPGPYGRIEKLPRSFNDVDAPLMTQLIGQRYPGVVVNDMEVVELKNGHTTKVRVKLDLNAAGRDAGIPEQVCIKANWSGSFAGVDIHALEAAFYHNVAGPFGIPAPICYFADWDAGETHQGIVMLEDLTLDGGRFGHSLDHIGVDGAATAMEAYARFHGASWRDPRLATFDWLPVSMRTPVDNDQLVIMWEYVERNLVKEEYRALLPPWLLDDPQRIHRVYAGLAAYEQSMGDPTCVVQGDSHQGNSFVRASGQRIWYDWQLVRKGHPWRDLSYFLTGALTIAERRAEERRLLDHYREHLVATGAEGVPDRETIWQSYRRWPIYGCQAWIANVDEWGQNGLPMNERFYTAAEDLGTAELLEAALAH